MICGTGSDLTATDCSFDSNTAGDDGGGIANYQASISLSNCNLTSNNAVYDGGGIEMQYSDATLSNCHFVMRPAIRVPPHFGRV